MVNFKCFSSHFSLTWPAYEIFILFCKSLISMFNPERTYVVRVIVSDCYWLLSWPLKLMKNQELTYNPVLCCPMLFNWLMYIASEFHAMLNKAQCRGLRTHAGWITVKVFPRATANHGRQLRTTKVIFYHFSYLLKYAYEALEFL